MEKHIFEFLAIFEMANQSNPTRLRWHTTHHNNVHHWHLSVDLSTSIHIHLSISALLESVWNACAGRLDHNSREERRHVIVIDSQVQERHKTLCEQRSQQPRLKGGLCCTNRSWELAPR
jgi:hypothetical protein